MSFSSKVKNEICRIDDMKACCRHTEIIAILKTGGKIGHSYIGFVTENAGLARRIFRLIKSVYQTNPEVKITRNQRLRKNHTYIVALREPADVDRVLNDLKSDSGDINRISLDSLKHNCCKRAYLRGAFLASGSVSDPEKMYHLEILTHNADYADDLRDLLNYFDLDAKVIERKSSYVVYLKEGDHITEFFTLIGASKALFDIENVRIFKGIRNKVNRKVNCETANLNKTVTAAMRQCNDIQLIKDSIGISRIPINLKEIARLRLKYRQANLRELGTMLSPPIGKSGVSHRLKKLREIAEKLRNENSIVSK